jgi:RimJ/RimL family protein N-acetyltransferase
MQPSIAYAPRNSPAPVLPLAPPSAALAPALIALAIRPVVATDRDTLERGFEALTADSKYNRFHAPMLSLPEWLARYLTEIDGIDHVALIGFEDDDAGEREPVGVARFIRNPKARDTAELAITIADRFQGRGIARRLLSPLAAAARERDIRTFAMDVLKGNRKARRLVANLGALARSSEGEVIRYELSAHAL